MPGERRRRPPASPERPSQHLDRLGVAVLAARAPAASSAVARAAAAGVPSAREARRHRAGARPSRAGRAGSGRASPGARGPAGRRRSASATTAAAGSTRPSREQEAGVADRFRRARLPETSTASASRSPASSWAPSRSCAIAISVRVSESRGAWLSAVRRSRIAASGRSAVDRPPGAELQRRDMGRVLGEHRLDQRRRPPAASPVCPQDAARASTWVSRRSSEGAVPSTIARSAAMPASVSAFAHVEPGARAGVGDRRPARAAASRSSSARAASRPRVWRAPAPARGRRAAALGRARAPPPRPGRAAAARRRRCRRPRGATGSGAWAHAVVLREEPAIAASSAPTAARSPRPLEHRELDEVQALVLGRGPSAVSISPSAPALSPARIRSAISTICAGRLPGASPSTPSRHLHRRRVLAGRHSRRSPCRRGSRDPSGRARRRGWRGSRRWPKSWILERELGQPLVAGDVAPVLLDQPQELADRLLEVALRDHQVGVVEPRRGVVAVELEDVAELDDRLLDLAFGDELGRPLGSGPRRAPRRCRSRRGAPRRG